MVNVPVRVAIHRRPKTRNWYPSGVPSGFHPGPFQILFPFHTHNSHLIGQIHTNLVPADSINVEISNSNSKNKIFVKAENTRAGQPLSRGLSICISLFDCFVLHLFVWLDCFVLTQMFLLIILRDHKVYSFPIFSMVLRERDFKQWPRQQEWSSKFQSSWDKQLYTCSSYLLLFVCLFVCLFVSILLEADSETFATISHFHNQLKVYVAFWRSKVWLTALWSVFHSVCQVDCPVARQFFICRHCAWPWNWLMSQSLLTSYGACSTKTKGSGKDQF